MKPIVRNALFVLAAGAFGTACFVGYRIHTFNSSVAKVYDVAPPKLEFRDDPETLARGKHLAESIGACLDCHGPDGAHGKMEEMGPVGRLQAPNVTRGKNGVGDKYTDAEFARVVRHGIKHDGTTVIFMPSHDISWWPDSDLAAVVSYMRTLPPVDSPPNVMEVGMLGKMLDRMDMLPLDIARRIDHDNLPVAPAPAPTAAYGSFLARLCQGCHGANLGGGPIPGAPPEIPAPSNLTPHPTGLESWSYEDFERLMRQGIKRDGSKLDPFMPVTTTAKFDDVEMRALWEYLRGLEAREYGLR